MSRLAPTVAMLLYASVLSGCAASPPKHQHNICSVFEEQPKWYDYAKETEDRWGTPSHILMAFVWQESGYQHNAKPPYDWFLFIPLGRKSSAVGYAQALDTTWDLYTDETGGFLKSRRDMRDALDFIGWYNDKSARELGISKWDPKHLYLAYHEGQGGYRRGSYKKKPQLIRLADKVDWQAREYGAQLRGCEAKFRCRKWYQVFCD